jgi:hypothetical protein
MTNIESLKAAYFVEVNKISDPLLKANTLVLLDEFIALKTAVGELSAVTLDGYSVAQRSITRRRIADAEAACRSKEMELSRALYGFMTTAYMCNDDTLAGVPQ